MIISQFSYLHLNLPKTNFHPSFTTLSPITRVTHHKSIPALSESHIAIPLEKKKRKKRKTTHTKHVKTLHERYSVFILSNESVSNG